MASSRTPAVQGWVGVGLTRCPEALFSLSKQEDALACCRAGGSVGATLGDSTRRQLRLVLLLFFLQCLFLCSLVALNGVVSWSFVIFLGSNFLFFHATGLLRFQLVVFSTFSLSLGLLGTCGKYTKIKGGMGKYGPGWGLAGRGWRQHKASQAILAAICAHSKDEQVLREGTRALEKHCPRALAKAGQRVRCPPNRARRMAVLLM